MNTYPIHFFHKEYINDSALESRITYRFKSIKANRIYFIEVERYKYDIYIAKFYLRIHKDNPNRYKIITNHGDAFRIFNTCVSITNIILEENPLASFGFKGESSIGEEPQNTKRFRIYSNLAIRYFSPKRYLHNKDVSNSTYFLLNKKNENITTNKVEKLFNDYYILN